MFDAGADAAEPAAGDDDFAGGVADMNGTWALVHEQSLCVEVAGQVFDSVNLTFEVVEIEQSGSRLLQEHRVCSILTSPILGLESVFPDEAVQSINPIVVRDSVVSEVGVDGSYSSGVELQLYGADLEDPWTDPLPADGSGEPVDNDEDGRPGVSIVVPVGSQSCFSPIIQRSVIRYAGRFRSRAEIVGTSTTAYEQVLVTPRAGLCNQPRQIFPNDPLSRFRMVRVDGRGGTPDYDDDGDGSVSCDELALRADLLWTRRVIDASVCTAE